MNNKGQYSIIAALLVAVILVTTVIITYSTIRNNPIQVQPQILSTIDETNLALKEILGFTIGYYGSVLQVTGNSSYARELAINYTKSGLENIARMRPELGASFNLSTVDLSVYWYTNNSWSTGRLAVDYDLTGLGLYGMKYETSCKLAVQVKETTPINQTQLIITKDEGEPLINLGKQNIKFYRYMYENSTWNKTSPISDTSITAYPNGTYLINMSDLELSRIDPYSYIVQVEDQRGIMVVASSFNKYVCSIDWNQELYSNLRDATIVVELLQNGTMRWLGQNFNLTTKTKPIPPIPVKAIHVNQIINGVNREVPFQIEDWASDYKIPLGLTSNASLFSGRTMLVFLINPNVSKVTIWWDGSDTATQTPFAYTNKHFTYRFISDTQPITISNGILNLTIDFSSFENVESFKVISKMNSLTATAVFMRINTKTAHYGWSKPMYAVLDGPVRDVLHHEVEWPNNGVPNCPNVYAHIVLTLPANATYYTYQLRLMFVESQNRTITDLCPIKITTSGSPQTENGTSSGFPIVQNGTGTFYNSSSVWQHHWSQIISGTKGAGIMFTDEANKMLYAFDNSTTNTGALKVGTQAVELCPITSSVSFKSAKDVTWYGAVVTFDGTTPIYNSNNQSGLWVTVEYPPTITVTTQS
ncbi:MAG: hypothetical protein ACUVQY_08395 [Thermoproteota archaeon]